jgi:hypothetical protein
MRLIAEEKKMRSLTFAADFPITSVAIVLGKFLALLTT